MPKLTRTELNALLAGPVIARLATVTREGTPYIAPVWQTWDGEVMHIIPRGRAHFVEHIRENPLVAISCADDVDPEHARVLNQGRAEITDGPAIMAGETLGIAREMAERYGGADGVEYLEATLDKPRYRISIAPITLTSWRGAWHPRYG